MSRRIKGKDVHKKEVLSMKAMRLVSAVMALVFSATSVFAESAVSSAGLTHGMAKSIVKGQTTQEEILMLFGTPNITTVSKKGEEVWTYDRISYTETTHGGADRKKILLSSVTGAGIGAIIGNQSKSAGEGAALGGILGAIAGFLWGHKNPVYDRGSKAITLMLWFDENDIVKDYSTISTRI